MSIARMSTIESNRNVMKNINEVMFNIADLQKKISSDRKVDDFFELGKMGGIERILDASKQLNDTKNYKESNQIVQTRLIQIDNSVAGIIDIAGKTRDLLTQRLSPSGKVMQMGQIAKSNLGQIQELLNANLAGRYLFSGSQTNVQPVGNLVANSNLVEGVITDNYYQGNDQILELQASTYLNIEYGVLANDDGFVNLIGAINMAIEADSKNDQEGLQNAMNLVNEALSDLTNLRSTTANNLSVIDSNIEALDKTTLYFQEITDDEMKVDIAQATLELGSNEAILRATYMTFARLSRLTLSEYL